MITSAGPGVQKRDKIGYRIHCNNGDTKGITAHLTDTLGSVNGYDAKSTKSIIEAFNMDVKLSNYFLAKLKYDSKPISGVMGLKNTADLMFDVSPKDQSIIYPPWMPNIRFSRYAITGELMCWGSFGIDPDIFGITNPTFYIHHTQIDHYCSLAGQNPDFVKPIICCSDYRDKEDEQSGWMKDVQKPVLEFLSNIDKQCSASTRKSLMN